MLAVAAVRRPYRLASWQLTRADLFTVKDRVGDRQLRSEVWHTADSCLPVTDSDSLVLCAWTVHVRTANIVQLD